MYFNFSEKQGLTYYFQCVLNIKWLRTKGKKHKKIFKKMAQPFSLISFGNFEISKLFLDYWLLASYVLMNVLIVILSFVRTFLMTSQMGQEHISKECYVPEVMS